MTPRPNARDVAHTKNGPYEPGAEYLVTEVLTWWMTEIGEEPEWLPVMGPLHHDREFFGIGELHYHIDPRFLTGAPAQRAERQQDLDKILKRKARHPAFQQLASWFPYTDGTGRALAFSLTDRKTRVVGRDRHMRLVYTKSTDWGRARIQKRTRSLTCRRHLQTPTVTRNDNDDVFRELRRHYGRKCRDVCPHRGYDLTSVPVDDKGIRQCPLHQLRVPAPKARRTTQPSRTPTT